MNQSLNIDYIFNSTDHRPWPLPKEQWVFRQTWSELAFIHWEIEEEELKKYIPPSIEIDKYEGKSYIGVVPFNMKGVTKRGYPAPKWISDFPEINVRTYVKYNNKPGVLFFSLDVPSQIAVWIGRIQFHLPYFKAKMLVKTQNDTTHYFHKRNNIEFEAVYTAKGRLKCEKNSFENWATERYCLYSHNKAGDIFCADVHHEQWPLESVDIDIKKNTLLSGLTVGKQHPTVLYSKSLDVAVYSIQKVL